MSIVWSNSNGWILCHSAYLSELYGTLSQEHCIHCGKYDIFHIHSSFLRRGQRSKNDDFAGNAEARESEVERVKALFQKMMGEAKLDGLNYFNQPCPRVRAEPGNITAVGAANRVLNRGVSWNSQNFNGENVNNHAVCISFRENQYFIPPKCKFFCCSVNDFATKIETQLDVILLDPPWRNKFVRRKNAKMSAAGYKLMDSEELLKIPINSLLCDSGLVIVWCTNSQRHVHSLINEIFPIWKVEYVSSWYWMKVTEDGRPICKFTLETGKKRPFERIIFGARRYRREKLKNPDQNKLIISIPSAIHSHKPPLASVLSEYIPHDAHCLEVFARYLLPNWTSTGDEVLKLQQRISFVS